MNDLEREQIRKEQKMANSFKFTKMSKKVAFLPALHTRGELQVEPVTSIEKGTNYLAHRDKEKLMFPDKVFEKEKKFKLNPAHGSFISTPVGQEFDKYDAVMLRYMRRQDRGEPRPIQQKSGETTVVSKSSLFLPGTNGVFKPNSFFPTLLSPEKPTFDQYDHMKTMRSQTCERNFSTAKWLYNKRTLDPFIPDYSKKDLARGKNLRKIQKKEEKGRSNSRGKSQDGMSGGYCTKYSLKMHESVRA